MGVTQRGQAGHHLPGGARYLIGQEIARRVVRRLVLRGCPSVIGAVLPFGFSGYNATYPGCIQLSPTTLTQVVVEVGECLAREGFTPLLPMSDGGGNSPSQVLSTQ